MTFYSTLQDSEFETYAVVRISMDYYSWFYLQTKANPTGNYYYLVTSEGKVMSPPGSGPARPPATIQKLTGQHETTGYFIDTTSNSIYNFNFIQPMDSYLVNRIPLENVFNEINKQKYQFFLTVLVLTLVFAVISLGISTTITRPLANLQESRVCKR